MTEGRCRWPATSATGRSSSTSRADCSSAAPPEFGGRRPGCSCLRTHRPGWRPAAQQALNPPIRLATSCCRLTPYRPRCSTNSGHEIGPAPRGQPRSLTGNLAGVAVGVRAEEQAGPVPDVPHFLNRELSRLDFDERVLAMAGDTKLPLLERVRFLAIFSSNLDDFFQVRVAGLKEQVLAAVAVASPDGMTPLEQLRAIRLRVEGLIQRQTGIFNSEIVPALAAAGITMVRGEDVTKKELSQLHSVFRQQIFPVLTPLAVDPAHPFPYISHLSLNLAVIVRDPQRHQQRFARVKVPPVLPRFVPLAEGERYIPLEDVIALHLQSLFPGMEIADHHPFRVTRDGDLDDVDSDAEDLLAAIQTELRRRRRHARVVRLEVNPGMSAEVLELLTRELELQPSDVYQMDGPLDLSAIGSLAALDRPDLKEDPWTPTTQPRLRGLGAEVPDLFAVLRAGDVLAHHPYD